MRPAGEAAVVPALAVALGGVKPPRAVPAVEAVFAERGAGLGVALAGLRVGTKGAVVVGDDEGVLAQAVAVAGLMLKPAEETFFRR